MQSFTWDDLSTVFEGDGAELRTAKAGDLTIAMGRVPAGADFRPALKGLPDDMCQCPHWGYLVKGKVLMRGPDGKEQTYEAGQAYYWAPGHAPEMLEDSEFVEFSPTADFQHVMDHINSAG